MRHRIKLEITGELSAETLNSLRSNPNVESISEDGIVHTMATQYALSYANQFISDFLVTDLMRLGDWAVSARMPNSPVKIPGMFLLRHCAVSDVQFERSPFHSAMNYQFIYLPVSFPTTTTIIFGPKFFVPSTVRVHQRIQRSFSTCDR